MPQIGFASETSIQRFAPTLASKALGFGRRVGAAGFFWDSVFTEALKRGGLAKENVQLSDADWWRQLAGSCQAKACSAHGSILLRERLVHSLSQRMLVDEQFRLNEQEIMSAEVKEPIFFVGLPRASAHMAAHITSRSGLFLTPTTADVMFPSMIADFDRVSHAKSALRWWSPHVLPQMETVRQMRVDRMDDDLALHMHCPMSLAWGLLHGLDDHLYKCLQEDQTPVYTHLQRVLKLFQWYRNCGYFPDNVMRELVPVANPGDTAIRGEKRMLTSLPWVVHSPLAILHMDLLHKAFPDMKVVWVHRALNRCVPSLCSSLALHNTCYTGKRPTETTMANIGEQIIGLFGSGSEHAIDYMGNFPFQRMVHWSNRDVNRSCIRLLEKTINKFGMEIDHYRRLQAINGMTEMVSTFRPRHDYELSFFGIHEGALNEAFATYILQFEEYAFEKKHGMKIQDFPALSGTRHHHQNSRDEKLEEHEGHTLGMVPSAGTYLQDYQHFKR